MSVEIGLLSPEELASLLGLSGQTVRDLQKKGKLTGERKGNRFVYDPYVCIPQYISYVREQYSSDEIKERKAIAEADLVEAKAGIARLEYAELRGEMHRSDDVRFFTADYFAHMRAEILTLPTRIPVLLDCADKVTAAEKVSNEIAQVLERMKAYNYSAKKYRDAVRQRRGWKEKPEDETNDDE